ncbi:MAG: ABC transporter substrate-binding protein [bacterium]|nr:ABC transporter substrate-binding protein [bacterium]
MSREFRIKGGEKILALIKNFTATQKVVFGVLVIISTLSAMSLALKVNNSFLMPVPAHGGRLVEGVVGLPRSINSVLAFTDVDRDIASLVYSGLMKYEDGKIVPDSAEKYSVSSDGLTYTFTLKDDVRFHDGVPMTTDDVEFTIQKIQDSIIKSPRRADWANVAVKKINPSEIQFILKQPYAPFLSNMTLGILPKHIWSKIDSDQFIYSQYNIEPIGSGPYRIKNIQRDSGGIPISYSLTSFSRYHDGEPYISDFVIYFYPNEKSALEARDSGIIESISRISAGEAAQIASTSPSVRILRAPLPRIFGVFFNQNQAPLFAKNEVRQALDMAVDKEGVVREVLYGYGMGSDSPLPSQKKDSVPPRNIDGAKALLAKNGWVDGKKGNQVLEFSIATADSPDLKQAAEIIKRNWEEIGASVTIKVFEYGDLYQNVIATRKYDALLFGESVGKDLDLYAFWHSSQRNSPGLNVAMYVNSRADKLLEDARITSDAKDRDRIYSQFEKIVRDDIPAVFLYSPEFIYIVPDKLKGISLSDITSPTDRFYGIGKWYVKTDNVWKIFNSRN